jgi:hypothetical protein
MKRRVRKLEEELGVKNTVLKGIGNKFTYLTISIQVCLTTDAATS